MLNKKGSFDNVNVNNTNEAFVKRNSLDSILKPRRNSLTVAPAPAKAKRKSTKNLTINRADLAEYEFSIKKRAVWDWYKKVVGKPLPSSDVFISLGSGVSLCELLNSMFPGIIPNIAPQSSKAFLLRENISLFLDVCEKTGLPKQDTFLPEDLFDKKNLFQVLRCVEMLAKLANKKGYPILWQEFYSTESEDEELEPSQEEDSEDSNSNEVVIKVNESSSESSSDSIKEENAEEHTLVKDSASTSTISSGELSGKSFDSSVSSASEESPEKTKSSDSLQDTNIKKDSSSSSESIQEIFVVSRNAQSPKSISSPKSASASSSQEEEEEEPQVITTVANVPTSSPRNKSKSESMSRSNSKSNSESKNESKSRSNSKSNSKSNSESNSRSHSKSVSRSNSKSNSKSMSRSNSISNSNSKNESKSISYSKSKSRSHSKSNSESGNKSHSKSISRSMSRSMSRSHSRSISESMGRPNSKSNSESNSNSLSRSNSASSSSSELSEHKQLIEACRESDHEYIHSILSQETVETKKFRVALKAAGESKRDDTLKFVVDLEESHFQKKEPDFTPLYVACYYGLTDLVDLYLKAKVKSNKSSIHGWMPLHVAAYRGHGKIVKKLIEEFKADIDAQDEEEATPLFYAICASNNSIVEYLLHKLASPDLGKHNSWKPIHLACYINNKRAIRMLIEYDVDLNCTNGEMKGNSALHFLITLASTDQSVMPLIKSMVKQPNVDINASNTHGATPLHLAVFWELFDVVELLVVGNADLQKENRKMRTAAQLACLYGHKRIATYLCHKTDTPLKLRSKEMHTTTKMKRAPYRPRGPSSVIGLHPSFEFAKNNFKNIPPMITTDPLTDNTKDDETKESTPNTEGIESVITLMNKSQMFKASESAIKLLEENQQKFTIDYELLLSAVVASMKSRYNQAYETILQHVGDFDQLEADLLETIPFSLRQLRAELLYILNIDSTLNPLYQLLEVCRQHLEKSSPNQNLSHISNKNLDDLNSAKNQTLLSDAEDPNIQDNVNKWNIRENRIIYCLITRLVEVKQYPLAVELLNELIEKHPNDPIILSTLGRIFLQIGCTNKAQKIFQKIDNEIIQDKDNSIVSLMNNGFLLISKNLFLKAIENFEKILDIDKENLVALNNLSICYLYCKDLSKSIFKLEEIINNNPEKNIQETIIFNLCTLYDLSSDSSLQKKKELMKKVLNYYPDIDTSCFRIN